MTFISYFTVFPNILIIVNSHIKPTFTSNLSQKNKIYEEKLNNFIFLIHFFLSKLTFLYIPHTPF